MNYLSRAKEFRTRKKLGQNFLIDASVLQKIVSEADPSNDETILEIGGGAGFLTELLAQQAGKVLVVELDPRAVDVLEKLPYDNIDVIHNDILKVNFADILDKPVKIAANIPYYITSPILVHLLGEIGSEESNRKYVKEILLMVQYEVAKRILADNKSGSKDYGLLSILVNYWCETEMVCKVPSRSFYPAPKVDSAVIKLKLREKPLVDLEDPKLFRRVIQACFSTRRKNIKNALCMKGFDQEVVLKALEKAGVDPTHRGETLSIQDFKVLTDAIQSEIKS